MSARSETRELKSVLNNQGIEASFEQAEMLRKAQKTLHSWDEAECGNSNNYASWSIERHEISGIPFHCTYPHNTNRVIKTRIPDREAGALRRVAAVCRALNIGYYHQSDCRGAALYVGNGMDESNYSGKGVCCAV